MCLASMLTRNKTTIYSLALWASLSVWVSGYWASPAGTASTVWGLLTWQRRERAVSITAWHHGKLSLCIRIYGAWCRSQMAVRWQHNKYLIYCCIYFNWVKTKIKQKGVVKEWFLCRPYSMHRRPCCLKKHAFIDRARCQVDWDWHSIYWLWNGNVY